ncbi:hypothetical protein DACRYDRAFT_25447 [Dacryopinax primogenitus]|uniref:DUF6533 domain-containing protein n=1 Tax=Dacryopinax primogenitus (strain DJM 731) TaxID=1858805 RepID=M5FZU9_DACPD|nr:uncharacterized protein DACRYDRAFT_25447 [Dacryopinax primogenitus]EJT97037.1 hypothetical protein DACRYDRAFT_25447 [Dacryopinax primogenitus]
MKVHYALTFEEEVRYIWREPKNGFGVVVFFLNRYLVPLLLAFDLSGALAPNPSLQYCVFWYLLEEFGAIFSIALVEIILMTQAWVLYGGDKKMKIVLWTLLGMCFAASFILIGIGSTEVTVGASKNPGAPGCVAILTAHVQFWQFWSPWMFLSIVVFVLTIARAHAHAKGDVTTHLGEAIMRDGIYYFGIIAVASTITVVIFVAARVSLQSFAVPWFQVIASISGSRLLLNMRRVRAETITQYVPVTRARRRPPFDYNSLSSFSAHRRLTSSQRPLFLGSPNSQATWNYSPSGLETPDTSPFPEYPQMHRRASLD